MLYLLKLSTAKVVSTASDHELHTEGSVAIHGPTTTTVAAEYVCNLILEKTQRDKSTPTEV